MMRSRRSPERGSGASPDRLGAVHADLGMDPVSPDAAFDWFFRAEYGQVVRTVGLILRRADAAEDITQEAFLRLHLHWSRVCRYDRPDAWVRRVALNLAATQARREGRRASLERRSVATGAQADAATTRQDQLWDALLALPYKQRALVVLYYFEDRPLTEAADLVGLTTGSAKVTLHRARQRLAIALDGTSTDTPRDSRSHDDH